MSLRNDILKVSGSNIVVLLSSIINGFVLPAVLSIDDYSKLKTYTLYASFIGFLHLGFVDGINIKYGGKLIDDVSSKEFNYFHKFFVVFQFIVVLVVFAIGIISKNTILIFIGLTILPLNLKSLFLFFYQAIGNFKLYSQLAIIAPLVSIFITLLLVLLKVTTYEYYIMANIIGYVLAVVYIENKIKIVKLSFNLPTFKNGRFMLRTIFYSGFFIMLGNTLFVIFFNIGRWMSKLFMSNVDFAIYSFGMSLIGFITIFINAVTQSFYPHLSRNYTDELISRYRNLFLVIGSFSIIGYFFIVVIVENFISKYNESLILTGILITTIPGVLIVKSLYVNLYKVLKKERQFLFDISKMLLIAILLSAIIFYFNRNTISIAISAVISIYLWIIFPPSFIRISIKERIREFCYLCLIIGGFIIIIMLDIVMSIQILITILLIFVINFIFYKRVINELIARLRNTMKKIF